MSRVSSASSERALVLAPLGRDAQIAGKILAEAGIDATLCRDLPHLMSELREGAGMALIVEEALHEQDYGAMARWIECQPAWSDFPIVVLAPRGAGLERNPAVARYSQALGNVTFLERPFHPTTLVSVVQTALRGRRRQYDARERMDAIRAAEESFRTLAENMPTLCWMARPDGHIFWYNSRWYEYTGAQVGDHEGSGWEAVHDPAILPDVLQSWRHSIATGQPFEMTFPLRGADGVFRPFLTQMVPLRDEAGRIVRWFGTNTNVTRQQRDQEHLRLMVNELNHRVKNTLATIQSIAALTLRGEDNPVRARETLTSRIMALSKAHDVLTDEQWSGADLREIAALAAVPYQARDQQSRIALKGPEVRLPPKTAIAVALAFHELATNAAKYGALSVEGGWVDLEWRVRREADHRALGITWREHGGPPVTPPKRTGFGTRLIQRGLAAELNGRVDIHYPPEGVICEIEARLWDGPEPDSLLLPSVEDMGQRAKWPNVSGTASFRTLAAMA